MKLIIAYLLIFLVGYREIKEMMTKNELALFWAGMVLLTFLSVMENML